MNLYVYLLLTNYLEYTYHINMLNAWWNKMRW